MIELGHYALVMAIGVAVIQIFSSVYGVLSKDLRSIKLGLRTGIINFSLVSFSMLILAFGFLQNDFSVKYIALNSNAYLPWYYKIAALWSGHEGSLLLWVWVLTFWTFLVAIRATSLPPHFIGKVFTVLGVITLGFVTFVVLTSNPFQRLLPHDGSGGFPLIGKDLNPLLQDIGLILHPPLLYMGYVGFAVSFAFIVAGLWEGRIDTMWVRWIRPWVNFAWAFLTIGIALGSWWAYYELGWGGWWFWDPVENASFMPWLAATALIHSLAATEKRDVFKVWTAFLAITTFSLSLIGTFLVRSGVLTSVHAFASDPTRGLYILMLLGLISGSAFLLLIIRAHKLRSSGEFQWISREVGILANNLLLSVSCLIVFIGTLSPLFYEVMGWQRISVGAAYFNAKMLWVLILVLVFLSFAPYLRWKKDRLPRLWRPLSTSIILGSGLSYYLNNYFDPMDWQGFTLLSLIFTALLTTALDAFRQSKSIPFLRFGVGKVIFPSRSYIAMFIAHIGFLFCCAGIVLTSTYSTQSDKYVRVGDSVALGGLSFKMTNYSEQKNKLYNAAIIDFQVSNSDGEILTTMSPEKRHYSITQMPIAESAIDPGLTQDIYLALGEPQSDGAWSVRLQIKPYIRWIWLGALIMAFSAFFSIRDKRRC